MKATLPPCALNPEMYQDEVLYSPPSRREVTAEEWRNYQAKKAAAHRRCAGCEVFAECLHRAVVEVDVAGFLACTSEADRRRMRRDLGIEVELDSSPYGMARVGGGPVDHETVIAVRRAYPDDTNKQLADRLGCSASTVKRHLRQERERAQQEAPVQIETRPTPTVSEVLDAFDRLDCARSA